MEYQIITHFDYPTEYPYLKERFGIFYKFTYPSVMSQTDKNFKWFLIAYGLYTKEPRDLKIPNTISISNDEWHKSLKKCIQTRLDNDDMILPRYVELARKNIKEGYVLDFKGYRLDVPDKRLYTDRAYHNTNLSPFLTILDDKPIWDLAWHTDFHKVRIPMVIDERMWVQVIHPRSLTMSQMKCNEMGDYVCNMEDMQKIWNKQ